MTNKDGPFHLGLTTRETKAMFLLQVLMLSPDFLLRSDLLIYLFAWLVTL